VVVGGVPGPNPVPCMRRLRGVGRGVACSVRVGPSCCRCRFPKLNPLQGPRQPLADLAELIRLQDRAPTGCWLPTRPVPQHRVAHRATSTTPHTHKRIRHVAPRCRPPDRHAPPVLPLVARRRPPRLRSGLVRWRRPPIRQRQRAALGERARERSPAAAAAAAAAAVRAAAAAAPAAAAAAAAARQAVLRDVPPRPGAVRGPAAAARRARGA
jgi:hypothetical protein